MDQQRHCRKKLGTVYSVASALLTNIYACVASWMPRSQRGRQADRQTTTDGRTSRGKPYCKVYDSDYQTNRAPHRPKDSIQSVLPPHLSYKSVCAVASRSRLPLTWERILYQTQSAPTPRESSFARQRTLLRE